MPTIKRERAVLPEHLSAKADQDSFKNQERYRQYKRGENPGLGANDEVYEYVGQKGKGFIVVERKEENGTSMIRRTNYGPETHLDHDWEEEILVDPNLVQ